MAPASFWGWCGLRGTKLYKKWRNAKLLSPSFYPPHCISGRDFPFVRPLPPPFRDPAAGCLRLLRQVLETQSLAACARSIPTLAFQNTYFEASKYLFWSLKIPILRPENTYFEISAYLCRIFSPSAWPPQGGQGGRKLSEYLSICAPMSDFFPIFARSLTSS